MLPRPLVVGLIKVSNEPYQPNGAIEVIDAACGAALKKPDISSVYRLAAYLRIKPGRMRSRTNCCRGIHCRFVRALRASAAIHDGYGNDAA